MACYRYTVFIISSNTPLATFLFLKKDEYIYRPRQCGLMQFFFRLGVYWGGQEAAGPRGEDERDTLRHVLSGGMSGTRKSAGQICRKFHFPNALGSPYRTEFLIPGARKKSPACTVSLMSLDN